MCSENYENVTDNARMSCKMKSATQASDTETNRASFQHKRYNLPPGAQGASRKTGLVVICCVPGKHKTGSPFSLAGSKYSTFTSVVTCTYERENQTARKPRTRERHFLSAPQLKSLQKPRERRRREREKILGFSRYVSNNSCLLFCQIGRTLGIS